MQITDVQRTLGNIGRAMMDAAVTTEDAAESNRLAQVGSMLTEVGTIYGPTDKDFTDDDQRLILDFIDDTNPIATPS